MSLLFFLVNFLFLQIIPSRSGTQIEVGTNSPEIQLFADLTGDRIPDILVRPDGTIRLAVPPAGSLAAGGWGRTLTYCVPCSPAKFWVEAYDQGKYIPGGAKILSQLPGTCPAQSPDLDGNCKVDLKDYAILQIGFTGP